MELTVQERKKLTMVKTQVYVKAWKTKKSVMLENFCEGAGYCGRHVARSGSATTLPSGSRRRTHADDCVFDQVTVTCAPSLDGPSVVRAA
jgi:hypothetical protein